MKNIDITKKLERKKNISRVAYSTLYVNKKHIAFSHKIGIGFVKLKKGGVRRTLNGRVRWYNTCATSLVDSLRAIRKIYKVQVPSSGWEKIRVRHYSNSEVEQIIINL